MASTIPVFHLALSIKAHTDNINTIAFAKDGKHFASGGDDGLLCVTDTKTGKATHRFRVIAPIRSILWHPSHNNAITAGLRSGLILTIQTQKNNVSGQSNFRNQTYSYAL
jgi:WD40 repeat protein